jgi:hypothetical protein
MKSCFLLFIQSFFLVSLLLSLLLPSTGSYFVLAIASSIDSFFLYSSDSSLLFLYADSSVFVRLSDRTNSFPFPAANMQPPLTAIIPMQTGTAFLPQYFMQNGVRIYRFGEKNYKQ